MGQYCDKDFNPKREFWNAMTTPAKCPKCGYMMNGTIYKWKLLNGPLDFECNKCMNKWSVAIPLGICKERSHIEKLLDAENEFYILRNRVADLIKVLHGK